MWWKIIVEVLILAATLFLGSGFWAWVKSSKHLKAFLADSRELQRFIDHIGTAKIAEESRGIKPTFGSYAKNIEALTVAHFISLRQTASMSLIGIIVLLIVSFLLGVYYFLASLVLFLLVSIGDIPASAKNNNATHVHSLISNIHKWHHTDPGTCQSYCIRERPSLMHLYGLVVQIPA